MKKNGFTLVEILAVLVLIAAIVIISVPSVLNYINGSKNEISEVTKKMVFNSTEMYLKNQSIKLITNHQKYCVTLQTLVDSGLLDESISDADSLEELDLNQNVEVTYQYDDDLEISKYNYQIVDNCVNKLVHDNGEVLYYDVKKGKVCNNYHEDNSKTGYNGLKTTTSNQNSCLKFYIFNDYEETERLNLLLDHNTTATVNWDNSGDNQYGPRTLLAQLKKDTNNWVGTEQPNNYTDKVINKTIDYKGYKARLITASDIYDITGVNDIYFFTTDGKQTETCREGVVSGCLYKWLYDNFSSLQYPGYGTGGYWAADACDRSIHASNGVYFAKTVQVESFNVNGVSETSYRGTPSGGGGMQVFGVRPVIEVDKSNL